jgi:hypothetical protein
VTRTDHHARLEDVVFNVFEDVNDSSANDLSGFYLKISKKQDSGNNTLLLESMQTNVHFVCLFFHSVSSIS